MDSVPYSPPICPAGDKLIRLIQNKSPTEKLSQLPDEVYQDQLLIEKGNELNRRSRDLRDWVKSFFPDSGIDDSSEISECSFESCSFAVNADTFQVVDVQRVSWLQMQLVVLLQ